MAKQQSIEPAAHEVLVAGQTYRTISVWPQWAWAIMYGGKDIENRSFRTQPGRLLIHASSKRSSARDLELDREEICHCGGLSRERLPDDFLKSAILGSVELVECIENARSPWAAPGSVHWRLRDPRLLAAPIQGVDGWLKVWNWTPTAKDVRTAGSLSVTPGSARNTAPPPPLLERASPPGLTAAPAREPRSIEDFSPAELLTALRGAAKAEPANEVDVLRGASRRLGFARMGTRVEKALKAQVRAGLRKQLFIREGDKLVAVGE